MPAFDPYRDWLGITDQSRPPHHYRLLGLPLFEDNPAAVAAAVTRWSALLQHFLHSEHASHAQRILREMEAAGNCLSDRQTKRDYDASLRDELTARPAAYEGRKSKIKNRDVDHLLPPQAAPAPPLRAKTPTSETTIPLPPPAVTPPAYPAALPPSAFPPAASPSSFLTPHPALEQPLPATVTPVVAALLSPTNYPVPAALPVPLAMSAPAAYGMPPALAVPQALPAAIVLPAAASLVPQATPVGVSTADAVDLRRGSQPISSVPSTSSAANTRVRERSKQRNTLALYAGGPAVAIVVIGLLVTVLKNQPSTDPADDSSKHATVAAALQPDDPIETGDARPFSDAADSKIETPATLPPQIDPPARAETPDPPSPMPLAATGPQPEPKPVANPPIVAPPKPAVAAEDAAKNKAAAQQALAAARSAMSQRDLRAAREQLKKAANVNALDAEIARVELMVQALDAFWNGVREGIKGLEAGGQATIRDTVVGVVEVSPDKLILRVNGENKTYVASDLPPGLALGLAENWLAKGTPETKLAIGAFQAMDSRADRAKAKPLFEEAAALGKSREAAMLIEELGAPVPTPAAAGVIADNPKPGADGKYPVPSIAAQAKAKDEVRAMFEVDYVEAKDAESKLALADKLAARAAANDGNATLNYMLMAESQELAAQSGNFEQALASIDKLAESYAIDSLDAKGDMLLEAAKSAEAPEINQALCKAALALSDEAVLLEKPMQALRTVRIALGAARKSRDPELLKQASAREKEIKELKKP